MPFNIWCSDDKFSRRPDMSTRAAFLKDLIDACVMESYFQKRSQGMISDFRCPYRNSFTHARIHDDSGLHRRTHERWPNSLG